MTATQSKPGQAWAHRSGLVDMGPHKAIPAGSDPLDRFAIHEAFARFGIAHDENRIDILETCFTQDATLIVVEGSAEPLAKMEGREAILRGLGSVISQQTDQRRHAMSNIVIDELTDADAKALAYGLISCAADDLWLGCAVIYTAELRKEDDGAWRFTRLVIGMDMYTGAKPEPKL